MPEAPLSGKAAEMPPERLNLKRMVEALPLPNGASYSVARVGDRPRAYVGIDNRRRPCLMVEASRSAARTIRRRGILLAHRVRTRVTIDRIELEVEASLALCEAEEPSLQDAFLSVAEIVLMRIGDAASEEEVTRALDDLVRLLERVGDRASKSAIGLFGELLVLELAADPVAAVRAWRVHPTDRFDIDAGEVRIEVKASGTRRRAHEFSLEQCIPEPGATTFLASTIVLESAGGTTARELADRLASRLGAEVDLLMKLETEVLTVLGLRGEPEARFDEGLARDRLRFFPMTEVPGIRVAPPLVDQVRFRADLTDLEAPELEMMVDRWPSLRRFVPLY